MHYIEPQDGMDDGIDWVMQGGPADLGRQNVGGDFGHRCSHHIAVSLAGLMAIPREAAGRTTKTVVTRVFGAVDPRAVSLNVTVPKIILLEEVPGRGTASEAMDTGERDISDTVL